MTFDSDGLLRALTSHGVQFIVVGGVAAVLHGAPTVTKDLDIVPARSPENLARLKQLLDELDARFRYDDRNLRPNDSHLSGNGQLLLSTKLGPLDVLLRLHDERDYDALLPNTVELADGDEVLSVIDIETLIAIKMEANRPKDRIMLPVLLALVQEQQEM